MNYAGTELGVFSNAHNWKRYVTSFLGAFLKDRNVAEIGAGIGSFSEVILDEGPKYLTLVEPDQSFATILKQKFVKLGVDLKVFRGTIDALSASEKYDAICYFDVLEHIENDEAEVGRALGLLRENGNLIILVPAFQTLYSEFDRAVGHFRRYDIERMKKNFYRYQVRIECRYLDSCGLLLSIMNRFILRSRTPKIGQIAFWDNYLVSISRILDFIFRYKFGRSLLVIVTKID
jgi:SAM-dependent methyltransferase